MENDRAAVNMLRSNSDTTIKAAPTATGLVSPTKFTPTATSSNSISTASSHSSGTSASTAAVARHVPSAAERLAHSILAHPEVLAFVQYDELRLLPLINTNLRDSLLGGGGVCYWQTMCTAFAAKHDLYCPRRLASDPRRYLSEELFTCRRKWDEDHVQQQIFKIRVSSRFKPGEQTSSRFALPLHQFLKVRNAQKKRGDAVEVFVGEKPPERFLDALLGSVMSKPVLLPDSQKVVDRSVAVACISRGGKDPFTGSRLTGAMLVPLPELAEEIAAFQQRAKNVDIGIDAKDAMELVDGVDPVMLEAMVAVEQLKFAARRAYNDALDPDYRHHHHSGQDGDNNVLVGAVDPASALVDANALGHPNSHPSHASHATRPGGSDIPTAFDESTDPDDPSHGCHDDGTSAFVPRWLGVKAEGARLVDVCKARATVTMNVPGSGIRPFYFNAVFPHQEDQTQLYNNSAQGIVASALNGSNGCIICYGQTGSGKTHTMFGPPNVDKLFKSEILDNVETFKAKEVELLDRINENCTPFGVVIRSFAEALRAKKRFEENGNVSLTLTMQYVEIYNEKTTDLLSGHNVQIRRGNGELVGASEVIIDSIADAVAALHAGGERKHFAATAMNERSSRSHTVIVLHIAQTQLSSGAHQKSHLYLVDLAGCERVKKSKVEGEAFTEAKNINSSLLVLGRVIASLSRSGSHVPYYESQLTTLLKGVFGGNCKTSVVVTCRSDDSLHGDEILESLRFGEQCSMISNVARSAATSVSTVMRALDDAVSKVEDQMVAMRQRGMDHVASFAALEAKLTDLRLKRERVLASAAAKKGETSASSNSSSNKK